MRRQQFSLSILSLVFAVIIQQFAFAQPVQYPKYYFRNPLSIPMEIQSNFGELRPDHWHMGLDIRTAQKENQSVLAAAEGYIASIGVRPSSFGRFIIINHPNGLSTLYAHLNDFYPELEAYVTQQQYEKESWAVELNFTSDQFRVSKGQFIAFSGNTGGSQGPHLHFEIFNTTTGERLNPLLLNFPVQDNFSPVFKSLAMYDRSKTVYDQVPVLFPVKYTDSGYIISRNAIIRTGLNKVSFAVQAYDKMSSKGSEDGIYSATLSLDEEPQVRFVLDSISYDETLYINSQIDYKYRSNGGAWLQHLSRMPGDHGNVYQELAGTGIIDLMDTNQHLIRVVLKDAFDNSSVLNFIIQHDDSLASNDGLKLYNPHFIPNQKNGVTNEFFKIAFPEHSFYDSVRILYYRNTNYPSSYALSPAYQVNDASIPINETATVWIKPDKTVPEDWKEKLLLLRSSKGTTVRKAAWDGKWLTAKFNDLGSFQLWVDLDAPKINELGKGDTVNLSPASRIIFTPTDNFGIKNFRAELDSQWIRFTNDKLRNWIYVFDERCPFGIHHLKVTVEDLVGNTTTKEWWFKKYPYTPPPKKKAVKKKSSGKKSSASSKKKTTTKKKK